VAELARATVACAWLSPWSDRPAYRDTAETSFFVSAKHRGRGIGRELKKTLIDEARRLNFHVLIAKVAHESQVSRHLNESLGFQYVGTLREVGTKFGKLLDVHILQMILS
jgi:phosphinothricin acetyltransferase